MAEAQKIQKIPKIEIDDVALKDPYRFLLNVVYRIPEISEKPVCLMFVGAPGTGKSHLMTTYCSSNARILSDTTAAGIEDILDEFDADEGIKYVVVPDLVKVMCRKNSNSFTALMNIGLEEGFSNITTRYVKWKPKHEKAVNLGLITAITTDEYRSHQGAFIRNGFFSRTLLVDYDPDLEETAIHVAKGQKKKGIVVVPNKTDSFEIEISDEAAGVIVSKGRSWAKRLGEAPLRRVNFIRRFAKVIALMNGSAVVHKGEVSEVMDLLEAVQARGLV